MKNTLLVIVALLAGGCAAAPTMNSVAGNYEAKKDGGALRVVFLKNGNYESYFDGKRQEEEGKWEIAGDKIHASDEG
ncbi:uncharacterized protein METZ01_LOCUS427199, partial [marine metagenome]